MKKIIVTGGAGYIGSHTVVALNDAGYTPIVVDNFSNSHRSVRVALEKLTKKKLKLHNVDILDNLKLQKIFRSERPVAVIHFAALKAVGESVAKPLTYYKNNISGLLSVLEAMKVSDCKQLVFSSSCTVYGEPDKCPVTESTPQQAATSPYGATKQICERILQDVAGPMELQTIALRYFNPIGAHSSSLIGELPLGTPNNLIPLLTQAVAGVRPLLTVYGNDYPTPDGSCVRDYIDVMDLADAHVSALKYIDSHEAGYSVLNVGAGKGYSVLEVIKSFEKATGQKVPYKIGDRREGDIVKIWADVKESEKLLDWKAKRSLEDSLASAWHWQQKLGKD